MRVLICGIAAGLLISGSAVAEQPSTCWENFAGQDGFEAVVKAKPGVKLQASNAGTVSYANADKSVVWNFTTKGSPAYPSVVCRRLVVAGGDVRIETNIRCGASSGECEKLAATYRALDEATKSSASQFKKQ